MRQVSFYRGRLLLLGIGLWFCLHCTFAANRPLDVGAAPVASVTLTQYFDILEDPALAWTLDDVRTGSAAAQFVGNLPDSSSVRLGYSQSAFWLRLRLANTGNQALNRLLEIGNPSLAVVEFHQPDSSGAYVSRRTGGQLPFDTRAYAHRHFVFPITLPPHSDQVVYVRLQSQRPMSILAKLWTPAAFERHERIDYIGQAWYFGIASAMVVFNLLLFIALRDLIYVRYVLFVMAMSLTIATQNGLIKEFVLQDAPWWSTVDVMVGFCFTVFFALGFMRNMLNTQHVAPRLDSIARLLTWSMPLCAVGVMLAQPLVIQPLTRFIAVVAMFILATGIVCAWRRERVAYFFLAAFGLLCLAGVLVVARSLGVLAPSFWTENALRISSGLEMLLLAFALADRFNVMRQEKVNAQRAAIATQQRLVETLQNSERELEQRVALRTAELDQKNQDLRQAIASREDVERIARHDIKTPLGSLAAGPGLLRAGGDTSPHGEVILGMMEKAANRALDMVNLSLDLYQMENGSYVFHPRTVHLSEILQSVVHDLGVHAHSKSVQLVIAAPESAVYVQGDDSLCYSIVANLTKNAIEAAPEHSTVTLTVVEGPWVQLQIHNNGEVPAELKAHFFAKYSTSGKKGGSGLGTYSAQLLARVQGGTLNMASSASAGTTLTLTLAHADAPAAATSVVAHAEGHAEPSIHATASEWPPLKVLVVDDDDFNLMVIDSYLPQPPLQVSTAANGRLALQAVAQVRPDIIILDVEMPIMGGLEALERIREYQATHGQKPSYVAAYSGSDDPQSLRNYLAAGFDVCLKKPSSRAAVLALLVQGTTVAQ